MNPKTEAERIGARICAIADEQYDRAHEIKKLLEENSHLDLQDDLSDALLSSTNRVCHDEIKLLLEHGADPNHTDSNGQSALFYACDPNDHWTYELYCGRDEVLLPVERTPEIVQLLLENGADPNIVDTHGNTPIFRAIRRRSYQMVKYLLDYGADPEYTTPDGVSVLDFAKYKQHHESIMLIKKAIKKTETE